MWKNEKLQLTTIAAFGVLIARPALANPGDRIELVAGGTMTRGLHLSIDLNSGDVIKKSEPFPISSTENKGPTEERRTLTTKELMNLKAIIKESLAAGLESQKCLREDISKSRISRINPDAQTSLYVTLDGNSGHQPDRECESHAFDVLWTETYNAASGTHFPVPNNSGD